MPATQTRVVGSGFTSFNYDLKAIAFLDAVTDSGQRPVGMGDGPGWEAVHPLDDKFPREIATSDAVTYGTLTATIRELWNEPVWWQLAGLAGTETVIDVFRYLRARNAPVTATKIIKPPGSNAWRGTTYHNVTIVGIPDDDAVTIGALTTGKTITMVYTNKTPMTLRATA
jgi:hypothetical protein